MKRYFLCAALLLLPACSGPADEDSEGFRPPVVEARGDFEQRQERRFRRLDRDSDGVLAADERPRRHPERVAGFDADGDGKITRDEFMTATLGRFDAMDANRDREVTPQERTAANAAD